MMKNSKGDPTELKLIRQNNENKIKNFKYAIFGFRIFCGLVQEQFQIEFVIYIRPCVMLISDSLSVSRVHRP